MAGNNSEDNTATFFIIMGCFIVGIVYALVKSGLVYEVWRWIRLIELSPFYFIAEYLPFYKDLEIQQAWHFLWNTSGKQFASETITRFDQIYPKWIMWTVGIPITVYGARQVLGRDSVNQRFDDESLLRRWAPLYPHLKRFVDINPNEKPHTYRRGNKESYEFGASMKPGDFASLAPPLGLEQAAKKDASLRDAIWDGDDGFDRDLAMRSFASQLGPHYTGPEAISGNEKKIFSFLQGRLIMPEKELYAFCQKYVKDILKADRHRAYSVETLGYGSGELYKFLEAEIQSLRAKNIKALRGKAKKLVKDGSISEKQVEPYIRKTLSKMLLNDVKLRSFVENPQVNAISQRMFAKEIMDQHAFVWCGLMSLLTEARRSGVISVYAEFNWLKATCRPLWYSLHSVGRNTPFVEGAGAFAHWLIERQIGRSLGNPEVTEAVEALFIALKLNEPKDGEVEEAA